MFIYWIAPQDVLEEQGFEILLVDTRQLARVPRTAATARRRSLRQSQTALAAYYRKIARRIGGDVAVFATARKLATLVYRLLRWGQQYVDEGAEAFEKRYQAMRIAALHAKAKDLGCALVHSG